MSKGQNDQQHPHTEHNIHQGQEPKKGQNPNDPQNQPHDPKHNKKHEQPQDPGQAQEKPPSR
jgi:hypothetical protein